MTELEKQQIKTRLTETINRFLEEECDKPPHNIGFVPHNIESLMADAAFAVLMTATATNEYMKQEELLTA